MHLLNLVADRLWLVSGGTVAPWQDDLEAYRRFLLAPETAERPARPKPPSPVPKQDLTQLRSEVRKCEQRLEKLDEMRAKLAEKLADRGLYDDARRGELETWNRKYAEVMDGIARAEALWMDAAEALETAGGQARTRR
jgi:ATP-binding cassette, subfamily F, member 3